MVLSDRVIAIKERDLDRLAVPARAHSLFGLGSPPRVLTPNCLSSPLLRQLPARLNSTLRHLIWLLKFILVTGRAYHHLKYGALLRPFGCLAACRLADVLSLNSLPLPTPFPGPPSDLR